MANYKNTPAPKAPASLPSKSYDGDPTFVLPRKSSGPSTITSNTGAHSPKKANLNIKPSMKMPANSGVRKA